MPEAEPSPDLAAQISIRDVALRDVERTMIQIVQTSISMIGFGFTIHAFLQNADARASVGLDLDQVARRVGLALLTIGMLNLAWGLWNQLRYLAVLGRRYPMPAGVAPSQRYRIRSTFVIAALLLVVGAAAFVAMMVQTLN